MKKKQFVASIAVANACAAILVVRSWMSESKNGVYFMTYIWGAFFLLSLVSLVIRITAKS